MTEMIPEVSHGRAVEWWADKRPPYTGVLAKPIPAGTTKEECEAMRTVYYERIPALFAHYGIDPA